MRVFPDFQDNLVPLKVIYSIPEYDVVSIHRTNRAGSVLYPIERSIQISLNKK